MNAEDISTVEAAAVREKWLLERLVEARRQRDQYRSWFDKLNAATSEYIARVRTEKADADEALEDLRAKVDHVVNARTRHNIQRGEETANRILDMEKAGKSIAQTARDLNLSVGHVARIRGKAKRPGM